MNWLKNKFLNFYLTKKLGDLVGKISGAAKGYKTYTAGAILILQAVQLLLTGAEGSTDYAALFEAAKDPEVWTLFGQGLGLLGLRSAVEPEKKEDKKD